MSFYILLFIVILIALGSLFLSFFGAMMDPLNRGIFSREVRGITFTSMLFWVVGFLMIGHAIFG